jgi:hypothetical protein
MEKRDRLGKFSLDAEPIHDYGEWLSPYIASPQSETSAVALVYLSISPGECQTGQGTEYLLVTKELSLRDL